MRANCDKCRKDFDVAYMEEKETEDIYIEYLECPYCKERYPALKTNARMREIRVLIPNASHLAREKLLLEFKKEYKKINEE